MLKVNHRTLIFLSGLIWLGIGCLLLSIGINFIIEALLKENMTQSHPILNFLAFYLGDLDTAALVWITLMLFIGFLKGRRVLSKSINRSVNRILSLPTPVNLSKIYAPSYYFLLSGMILLGVIVRFTPQDIRGGIDICVGFALVNGAIIYFRQAWLVRRMA